MVVGYRVTAVTGFLVRRMGIKVEHASLVNLLVGHAVVPELMQEDFTPEQVATEVDALLRSEEARAAQREGFREVIAILGDANPPPSERAAKVVLDAIRVRNAVGEVTDPG
jgi:lipid-A-disaccharide synthase